MLCECDEQQTDKQQKVNQLFLSSNALHMHLTPHVKNNEWESKEQK